MCSKNIFRNKDLTRLQQHQQQQWQEKPHFYYICSIKRRNKSPPITRVLGWEHSAIERRRKWYRVTSCLCYAVRYHRPPVGPLLLKFGITKFADNWVLQCLISHGLSETNWDRVDKRLFLVFCCCLTKT